MSLPCTISSDTALTWLVVQHVQSVNVLQEHVNSFTVSMPPRRVTYSLQSQQRWLADEVQALIQVQD